MADGSHAFDIAVEVPQGLSYCSDEFAGLSRRRAGKGWSYRDAKGKTISDAKVLARIRALAIPPPGPTSGSAPRPMAISRPPAAT